MRLDEIRERTKKTGFEHELGKIVNEDILYLLNRLKDAEELVDLADSCADCYTKDELMNALREYYKKWKSHE